MSDSDKRPFFVGYLPLPAALKWFYITLIVLFVGCSALLGYTIASLQKSAGPADWQTAATETISGLLVATPYPVLHRFDPHNLAEIESILLVGRGKFSADQPAREYDQRIVSVTGYPIRRGGWFMLELSSAQAIQATGQSNAADLARRLRARVETVSLGAVNLEGEVADSKCFLGVMKPGAGHIHRACAEVCLLGGIPAMLLVRGQQEKKYGYMLTQADGSSAARALAKRAGEKLTATGELEQRGDLLYIRLDAAVIN